MVRAEVNEAEVIDGAKTAMAGATEGMELNYHVGKRTSFAKVEFPDEDAKWAFLAKEQGKEKTVWRGRTLSVEADKPWWHRKKDNSLKTVKWALITYAEAAPHDVDVLYPQCMVIWKHDEVADRDWNGDGQPNLKNLTDDVKAKVAEAVAQSTKYLQRG